MLDNLETSVVVRQDPVVPRCGRYTAATPWSVVHTHPQAERWAAANLTQRGYATYLPLYAVRIRDRVTPTMTRIVERPLFTSYLFVTITGPWVPVRYAPGVASLLMADGKPQMLPEGVVEALQASERARSTETTRDTLHRPGAPTEVILGGGVTVPAVVVAVSGNKATVSAMMFGYLRELTVDLGNLRLRDE